MATFFTSTSGRTRVQSSFDRSASNLLHLAARRAHQILPAAFADGRQILLAHDTAIKHPDPARPAVLAFDHAQNRLHQQRHCWQQQSHHTIARYQFTGAPGEYFRHLVPPVGQSLRCAIIHSNTGRSRSSIELALSSFQGGLPTTQSYWVAYASPAQDAFGSNEFPSKTFRLRSVGTRLSSTT